MKKLMLLTVLAAATITGAVAQNPDDVSFGPRVGLNLSNIADGEFSSFEQSTNNLNPGAVIGLVINIPFGKIMSIQPEVLFAQKGAMYKVEKKNLKGSYAAFVNNYVEIPLLAKARLGGKFYGMLEAGPYGGVWLNGVTKGQLVVNGVEGDVERKKYEVLDDYEVRTLPGVMEKDQRFDAGVALGTGFGFGAGSGNIEFDIRYNIGFVDRVKYENGRPDGVNKQMNRNFGLSAMFLF